MQVKSNEDRVGIGVGGIVLSRFGNLRDLKVWRMAHVLTLEVYRELKFFPKDEQFGLISQMRKSSVSIPTNIAEGCGRKTNADFIQFLHIALGSANELEYQLLLSKDLGYLTEEKQQSNTPLMELNRCLVL